MNATVLTPANDITIRGRIFKKASGYKPWLYDVTFDACRYLRRPNQPFVAIIYGLFKQFTNINHTCPYVGSQIIKDFYLRPELMRLPVPTGDYLLAVQWYFDKRPQFETNVSYTFVEDLLKSK
ncbi:GL21491 [Drosophila persimilis]|uniref:GL21491 n=2 Tax=Drosophila persimilis TaxID=7234 RepID=B4GDT7_DROPE|nr:GL21491 [Drosophila persimilis]